MKTNSKKDLSKKLTATKSILLCVLIFLSSSFQVTAQVPSYFSIAGAKYKVTIGETAQYNYTIINNDGMDYLDTFIYNPNHNLLRFQITVGTISTIIIRNTTSTTVNQERIEMQINYSLTNGSMYTGSKFYYVPFLYFMPGYENKSSIDQQVAYTNYLTNYYHEWAKDDDNYFYYEYNGTLGLYKGSWERIYDWHTGWLQSDEYNETYENGTFFQHTKMVLVSNNQTMNIIGAEVITISGVILVALAGLLVYFSKNKKKKQGKLVKEPTIQNSTRQLSRKEGKVNEMNVNKSLSIIDEILHETTQSEK